MIASDRVTSGRNHLFLPLGMLSSAVPTNVLTRTAKLFVNLNVLFFLYYNLYLFNRYV